MKNIRLQRNIYLRKINEYLQRKVSDNVRLIMGIMSLLLVFCGLVVGLLGRGWSGAWFLVLLGLIFGFTPCLSYLMSDDEGANASDDSQDAEGRRVLLSDESERGRSGTFAEGTAKSEAQQSELDRQAREFEAMLERQRLKKAQEEERRQREAEKERAEREASIKRETERLAAEKKRKEERRRAEEEKRERRRKLEEERRREAKERRQGSGSIYKAPVVNGNGEFFAGVSSREELRKRYKELIKRYHPDNGDGDVDALQKVQREYEELALFFEKYERHTF